MKTFFATFFLVPTIAVAAELAPTPSATFALVQAKGARSVVNTFWGTNQWSDLIAGVASGDPEWLKVAEAIRPGTDAGATSELLDAVAWALSKQPRNVLAVVSHDIAHWEVICNGPSVDFPSDDPARYYLKAISAVSNVRDQNLQKVKAICLSMLKNAAGTKAP